MMDEENDWNGSEVLVQNILQCLSKLELTVEQCDGGNAVSTKHPYGDVQMLIDTLKTRWENKSQEEHEFHQKLALCDNNFIASDNHRDLNNVKRTRCLEETDMCKVNDFVAETIAQTKVTLQEMKDKNRKELSTISLPPTVNGGCRDATNEDWNRLRCKVDEKLTALLSTLMLQCMKLLEKLSQHNFKLVFLLRKFLNHSSTTQANRSEDRNNLCDIESERNVDAVLGSLDILLRNKNDNESRFMNNDVIISNSNYNNDTNNKDSTNDNTINNDKHNDDNLHIDLINNNSDTLRRNVTILKRLIFAYNDNYSNLHDMLKQKQSEVEELDETTKYLNDQLMKMTSRTEFTEDENHVLKQKAEQLRLSYECSLEELNVLQNRLKMTEDEKSLYLNETILMKESMKNTKGYCHDLNDDREKLLEQVKQLQHEKKVLHGSLQEQIRKTNKGLSEYNDIAFKNGNLETTIAKLNREYFEVSGELKIFLHENDSLKNILQEKEKEIVALRRNMRAVELRNTDLEDQLFHITGQYQTTKYGLERLKSNIDEYKTMIEVLERKLREVQSGKMNNKVDSHVNDEHPEEKTCSFVVPLYEKLLSTFIQQCNELVSLLELDPLHTVPTISNLSEILPSKCSEYTNKQNCMIKSSYASIKHRIQSSNENWKSAEYYYHDLLHLLKISRVAIDDAVPKDQEHNQNGQHQVNSTPIRTMNGRRFRKLQVIVDKVEDLTVCVRVAKRKMRKLKKKIKSLNRIVRRLQNKLKHYKTTKTERRVLYYLRKVNTSSHECNESSVNAKRNYHLRKTTQVPVQCNPLSPSIQGVILKQQSDSLMAAESMHGILCDFSTYFDQDTKEMLTDACAKVIACLITTIKILKTISNANGSRLLLSEDEFERRQKRGSKKFERVNVPQRTGRLIVSSTEGSTKYEVIKQKNKFKMYFGFTMRKMGNLLQYLNYEPSVDKKCSDTGKSLEHMEEIRVVESERKERSVRKPSQEKEEEEKDYIFCTIQDIWIELSTLEKMHTEEEEGQIHLSNVARQMQVENEQLQVLVRKMASELEVLRGEKDYLMQNQYNVSFTQCEKDKDHQNHHDVTTTTNSSHNCCKYQHGAWSYHNHKVCANQLGVELKQSCDQTIHCDQTKCTDKGNYSCTDFNFSSICSDAILETDTDGQEFLSLAMSDGISDSILSSEHDYCNVVSSTDSHHSTTCSRVARNIKTSDASAKLRQECLNRSPRWKKETVYGLRRRRTSCDTTTDLDATSETPQNNTQFRVLGRREISQVKTKSNQKAIFSPRAIAPSDQHQRKTRNGAVDTKDYIRYISESYSIEHQDLTDDNPEILPFLSTSFQRQKRKKKFLHLGKK